MSQFLHIMLNLLWTAIFHSFQEKGPILHQQTLNYLATKLLAMKQSLLLYFTSVHYRQTEKLTRKRKASCLLELCFDGPLANAFHLESNSRL